MPDTQDDFYQAPTTSAGLDGFFSIEASKVVSISPDQPMKGWVTLGFTDEGDPFSLNAQMFYVPEPLLVGAVGKWLKSIGYDLNEIP